MHWGMVALVACALAGCVKAAPVRISADEAAWRRGCEIRHGQVIEQDGELMCVRERKQED